MTVHAVPSIPRSSSKGAGRWYVRIEPDSGPIRGTATGRHASWIEIDSFEIISMSRGPGPPRVTVRVVKPPDVATAAIYRLSASGTRCTVRVEWADRHRTLITGVLHDARILSMRIQSGNREEIEVVSNRVSWKAD
ncbi:MAG TPA: hypothetical protein VMM79_15600 [Longimicrobiales bacterium]|nr:hypothetical protein [Longimicrobiales bacterium]